MWWILILLLILDNGDNGNSTCDSLVWILLLSRFCDNGSGCGCGCATSTRSCGC